jgi:hypothetical protein
VSVSRFALIILDCDALIPMGLVVALLEIAPWLRMQAN